MGLTIACVFNDIEVRRHCLDRSLEADTKEVEVQYLPIDNTAHAFSSAGAALNHAVGLAHHDVVVFVHQDVYLHAVKQLAAAASMLDEGGWCLLGASGVTAERRWAGRLRDRVILIGEPAPTPVPVDTLDEVLFMARRAELLDEPLSEEPDLAWHAYAVEYALRARANGNRVGAMDMAITHNSLTANLARLDDAHHHVAARYPGSLPIHTTCGTLRPRGPDWRDLPGIRGQRWRRNWLRQSRAAARVRIVVDLPVVVADIAHEVDELDYSRASPLHLVNVDRTGAFAPVAGDPVQLERKGRPVAMSSVTGQQGLDAALDRLSPDDHVLVTGLTVPDLARLRPRLCRNSWLVGVQWDEVWLLGGPSAARPPEAWRRPQATPLRVGRART